MRLGVLETTRRGWSAVPKPWRRSGPVTCAEVAADLPFILDEGQPASGPVVEHVQTCLQCQAELARYRRLVRLLHQLQTVEIEPPPGVVADVLGLVGAMANRRLISLALSGRTLGYAGAAVAAAGATAALVALALAHRRHTEAPGAGAIVMGPGMLGAQPRAGLSRPHGGQ
ncbi:MAG: anti-sigma factor family protein [Acidimicrobiales bacterium]